MDLMESRGPRFVHKGYNLLTINAALTTVCVVHLSFVASPQTVCPTNLGCTVDRDQRVLAASHRRIWLYALELFGGAPPQPKHCRSSASFGASLRWLEVVVGGGGSEGIDRDARPAPGCLFLHRGVLTDPTWLRVGRAGP